MSRICAVLGITQADIKSINAFPHYDAYTVNLHNHRRLIVTGFEIANTP